MLFEIQFSSNLKAIIWKPFDSHKIYYFSLYLFSGREGIFYTRKGSRKKGKEGGGNKEEKKWEKGLSVVVSIAKVDGGFFF